MDAGGLRVLRVEVDTNFGPLSAGIQAQAAPTVLVMQVQVQRVIATGVGLAAGEHAAVGKNFHFSPGDRSLVFVEDVTANAITVIGLVLGRCIGQRQQAGNDYNQDSHRASIG